MAIHRNMFCICFDAGCETFERAAVEAGVMMALEPEVVDACWAAVEGLIPVVEDLHPLGCHRPRIADRACFEQMLYRLVLGCSWKVAGIFGPAAATTLRDRRNEWVDAGVFEDLMDQALHAYDRILGLELGEVGLDTSHAVAPCESEDAGPSPVNRAKQGYKWSMAVDARGIPLGLISGAGNTHDKWLLCGTLNELYERGLLADVETLHLDRGYDDPDVRSWCEESYHLRDVQIIRRNRAGEGKRKIVSLGLRWPVERTNSWLSNYGQLRRNTDRYTCDREAQLAFAAALIIIGKLVAHKKWLDKHCQPVSN